MDTITRPEIQPSRSVARTSHPLLPDRMTRARAYDRLANLIAEAAETERDHNTQRYLWTASADLFSAASLLRRGRGQ